MQVSKALREADRRMRNMVLTPSEYPYSHALFTYRGFGRVQGRTTSEELSLRCGGLR